MTITGITTRVARTEASLGLTKRNLRGVRDPREWVAAAEYEANADGLVAVQEEVGLHDGSEAGSLVARAFALEAGTIPAANIQTISGSTGTIAAATAFARVTYASGACALDVSALPVGGRVVVAKGNTSAYGITVVGDGNDAINGGSAGALMTLPGSTTVCSSTTADPTWTVYRESATALRVIGGAASGPQQIFRFNETDATQFGSVVKIAPSVGGSVVLSTTTTAGVPRLVMTGTNNGGVQAFPMALLAPRSRRIRFSFTQHSNVPGSGGFQVGLLASDGTCCIGYLHDTGGHSIIQVWAASNTSTAFLSTSPAWSANNPLRYVIDFDVPTGAVATGDEIALTRAVCPANGAEVKQYRRTTINANLNGKTFDRLFIATSDLDPTTDDDAFHFSDIHVENL